MDNEVTIADLVNGTWVNTSDANATLVLYQDGSIQGTLANSDAYTGIVQDTGKNAFRFNATFPIGGTNYTIPGLAYLDSNGRLVIAGNMKSGDSYYYVTGIAAKQ